MSTSLNWFSIYVGRFSDRRNYSLHMPKYHKLPGTKKPVTKKPSSKVHKSKLCGFLAAQEDNIMIRFIAAYTDEVDLECPNGCGRKVESTVYAKVHYFNCE